MGGPPSQNRSLESTVKGYGYDRASRTIRELENPGNELWLSPVSLWEVFTLCQKRRLALQPDPESWVASALSLAPLREALVTFEVARETERFQLSHGDPADKFLVATARVFDLVLSPLTKISANRTRSRFSLAASSRAFQQSIETKKSRRA
jgi:PIN domain nuclease of toxin-antitoxin system